MALVRIGLASLEMDSVSHARVSADRDKNEIARHFESGRSPNNGTRTVFFISSEDYAYNFVQWQIGVGSMWSEAIGLAPLKDRFPAQEPTLTIRSESGQP